MNANYRETVLLNILTLHTLSPLFVFKFETRPLSLFLLDNGVKMIPKRNLISLIFIVNCISKCVLIRINVLG